MPQISADLKPSSSQLLWMVDIYGFLVAGSLITMGTLGDRIGRRRLLMIGAAAFGAASVLAAYSRSAEMLIATRALLGIAGATLAPSTLSLIRNMFLDPTQRTFAIGVWVTSYSVGGAIGPLLGGIVLEYFWWGSIFLLGVPVMVLLLVVGPMLLPEFRDPKAERLDLLSAAQSLAAVLLVIYGLKKLAEDGLGWLPAVSVGAGVAIGILFVRRQRTLATPLIDLNLFRVPAFNASLAHAIYRMAMWDAVPGGVPPEASEAARNTLGGAVSVAGQLPAQLGTQLLGSAREAFIRAFQLTAAISAVVSLVTGVGVMVLLRRVGAGRRLDEPALPAQA